MTTLLTVAATILGIAGLAGAAIGVLTSRRVMATVEVQSANIEAQDKLLHTRDLELTELRAKALANEAKLTALTEVVTQAAKVDQLTEVVLDRHAIVIDAVAHAERSILSRLAVA